MAGGSSSSSSSSSTGPSLVDSLFQRSLDDLIKSLRSQPVGAEPALLSRALAEIRREIRSPDPDTKAVALQKLTYLSSIHGLDASWAAFHALELLPSPSPLHKRLAYLAASLSFHPSTTDVLPLATHQLRKDLSPSSPPNFSSLALHLLSLSASPDLARHLAPDILPLLSPRASSTTTNTKNNNNNSSPLRPKAAVATLHALSLCPDVVPLLVKPLVDCLSSPDPRVVSAAVGAFAELVSATDPSPYLPLAPEFYRLLTDSRNNWVLIKLLKIFARLAPLEPRLAARLVDPLCDLIRRSSAQSLVLECVRTLFSGFPDHDRALRLAVDKVKEFLTNDDDPNLRYLGLRALTILGPRNSWGVVESRDSVIQSLADPDPNIRHEALRLIMGMVFDTNVVEISVMLVNYAMKSDPVFANEMLDAVLTTCGRNVYELIVDFDWYVSLLGEMARNPHCAKGEEIERQLVDIGLRVRDARPELVRVARDLLIDPALLGNPFLWRILSAAAWVSGEYVEFSTNWLELVEALLQPRTSLLPPLVRAVYIQAVFKVLAFCFSSYIDQLEASQVSSLGHSTTVGGSTIECNAASANCLSDDITGTESADGFATADKPASLLSLLEKKDPFFTRESLKRILYLIETAVGPLSENDDVEVQERARNVLGLIHMLQEIPAWKTEEEGFKKDKDNGVGKIMNLMQAMFSEEIGPVSVNAQKRVPVPEGLVLEENLSDLAMILTEGDIAPSMSISFTLRSHQHMETKDEAAPSVQSTYLLAEHRKRHGLYYLPAEKDETELNDFPRAYDPLLPVSHSDATEDLVKLTEQSLIPRKVKHTKPRPIVLKMDEGDGVLPSALTTVKESKDDMLSGAIHEVLLGNEGKPSSSQKGSSNKSSGRRMKGVSDNSESVPQSKENLDLGDRENRSSSSRRSQHRSHGKGRHRSSQNNEEKEEKSHRNSTRSGHHHERHEHRQRGETPLNAVPQAPAIQDLLL
ncbi:AP-3 complex subunit delta [Phoenix dactylifera]|uniref:AP-3 complex subunit delta n=1 Tax=Phoenix dactylifera TaxID=42345 RepID=A0A8B7C6T7_PHODC|nr:AP-3 complex subunit delta [Phoenix dactylifera]XP_026661319.2 AP-3 complex subunit delta [Phoenix dactylifera]